MGYSYLLQFIQNSAAFLKYLHKTKTNKTKKINLFAQL